MAETMSPREKVARIVDDRLKFADLSRHLPGHTIGGAALIKADAILASLASSGDHAELARLAEAATPGPRYAAGGYLTVRDPDGGSFSNTIYHIDELGQKGPSLPYQAVPFAKAADAAFYAAANPATVLALIAEVAALRGEVEGWVRWADEKICEAQTEAAEAERKLAEAVRLLSELEQHVRAASEGRGHARAGVKSADAARTLLSKEAERG